MSRQKLIKDRVEQQQRRQRIERAMLRGMSNLSDLAAAHGVTVSCAAKDVKAIQKQWAAGRYMTAEQEGRAAEMVARLNHVIVEAYNSWERSCKKFCGCNHGMVRDKESGTLSECPRCLGREWLDVPGDVAYLNAIRATLVEIGRIGGVYPGVASVLRREINQTMPDGSQARTVVNEIYQELPLDMILRCRGELHKVELAAEAIKRGKPIPVFDAKVDDGRTADSVAAEEPLRLPGSVGVEKQNKDT